MVFEQNPLGEHLGNKIHKLIGNDRIAIHWNLCKAVRECELCGQHIECGEGGTDRESCCLWNL